ncbi:MAG: hypothetical protein NVSMB25_25900 [Thermoleophilaceae bacterium]
MDGHPSSVLPSGAALPERAGALDPRVEVGHVHLRASDIDRALAFYAGVLGFELQQREPDSAFVSAGGYHHHIGLNTWSSAGASPPPPRSTGLFHLAIRYPTRATLGDALARLVRAGTPLEGAADHGVSEAIYLRDPDLNGVELYWDRPRSEWPRDAGGSLAMVTLPLDLDGVLSAAEGGPRIDPRVDIGHVHLQVSDVERSLAFYRDVLGFELQQRFGPAAIFLSAGGYHHHIGANTWQSRGAGPPPPGHTGLHHHAIRYPDRAALADAGRRRLAAGHPLDGASDHGVSDALSLREPDGSGVELYRARPREQWPRPDDGLGVAMTREPFDVERLLAEA